MTEEIDSKTLNIRTANSWNLFLKDFGVQLNSNSVVSTNFKKYFHPKEALITDGVVSKDFLKVVNNKEVIDTQKQADELGLNLTKTNTEINENSHEGFSFLYPFGCSIKLTSQSQESTVLLNSGKLSFPVKDPLLVVVRGPQGAKLTVCGSYKLFTDEYIKKEENEKLVDVVFDLNHELLNKIPKQEESLVQHNNTFKIVPSIEKLSEGLKSAIQTNPDLSSNVFSLFENNLFKVHFNMQKETIQIHNKLNVERKPLTLISPVFETPMLGLTPSIFPPILMDIDAPELELYDLDDEFANVK